MCRGRAFAGHCHAFAFFESLASAIKAQSVDATTGARRFAEMSVPEAVVKFRQGIGRLIRSARRCWGADSP